MTMKFKQLIALPILGLALGNVAHAGAVPLFSSITGNNGTMVKPLDIDYTFNNRGLTVAVAPDVAGGGYTLHATGNGNTNFFQNSSGVATSSTVSSSYALTAHFNSSSHFVAAGSLVTINGALIDALGGTGTHNGLLYSADLTDFGYDNLNGSMGFTTFFNDPAAWSNQSKFTGGSTGEVLYLFDQVGLNTGHGNLSALTAALAGGDLSVLGTSTFSPIQSIATVPLPLPAVLFGTGLTALMGLGRKRRNNAKAV